MSDPEIYRRLDTLEATDRDLHKSVNQLSLDIGLLVQSTQSMNKMLEKLGEVDSKYASRFEALDKEYSNKIHILDRRLSNTEDGVKMVRFLGAGTVLALIGIAVTALFGKH